MVALRHKVRSEGDLERSVTTWRIYNENKLNVKATRLSLGAKISSKFLRNNETRKFTLAENFNTFIGMYKEVVSNYI